jgi:uncharacterized protein YmfQ (DUF2313 family)
MSNKLIGYLPNYYSTSKVITDITNAQDLELKKFSDKIGQTLNQFFIDTSDFTLERWEKELGLTINNSKPKDYRRSVIKSKIRGHGTVTVKLISNVCESFSSRKAEVIENNSDYSFTIKFVETHGQPPNFEDLKRAIEEIKPAHLGVNYNYEYITWEDLTSLYWNKIKNYTWNHIKNTEVK